MDREIGARMRTRRTERGLSQTALAKAVGVTFQQIQKYERGSNRAAAGTLFAIAEALDLPVAMFFPTLQGKSKALEDTPRMIELRVIHSRLGERSQSLLLAIARTIASEEMRKSQV